MTHFRPLVAATLLIGAYGGVCAEDFTMNYSAKVEAYGGPHDFAPYYIGSLRHGTLSGARGAGLQLKAWRPLDLGRRFSYSFGVEAWANGSNSIGYDRYDLDTKSWHVNSTHSARVWLQQLWGEVKFRGVYLNVGLKEFHSALLNERLSSGDLTESSNTRPIPGARVGFIDFQNIPFTNGWVQIQGELGYYKSTDNHWVQDRYDYFVGHIARGWWYNYKRMFFRTKPSQPFSVTVGLQASAQFAGICDYYDRGKLYRTDNNKFRLRDILDMVVIARDDTYVKGNHVGSWDLNARYRLKNGGEIKAYFQWLWEDGSGIGKLNGMDGLWGLEWKAPHKGLLNGAVFEVLTFMNQGGPLHYDPEDNGGVMAGHQAEGGDNYYNNTWYNGYAIYGNAIGSPMFQSPVYNTDGAVTTFINNRFWGLHLGAEGNLLPELSYRLLASYRRFYGTVFVPSLHTTHDVSAMVELGWSLPRVPGLVISGQVGFDAGNSVYGRKVGALVSASYSGIFNFKTGKSKPCVL